VTAREDELQPLVGECDVVHLDHLVLDRLPHVEQAGLRGQRPVALDAVDGPVACGRDQPRGGVVGLAVARPAGGGDRERLLRGFLGELEVAEEADQRSEDATPLLAEDPLEDG
jgi:hypothetical protein